eukprot:TRINITY_DN53710_c0_g3_i1.p2 TRINITY_DN53710_c0_g3~~TRINITY_DN53710_c0_g3_i1.p2  ORF type:complete len:124 (+),score=16.47 TRINITY_DN53710_c0_g3_i1:45-374(+)
MPRQAEMLPALNQVRRREEEDAPLLQQDLASQLPILNVDILPQQPSALRVTQKDPNRQLLTTIWPLKVMVDLCHWMERHPAQAPQKEAQAQVVEVPVDVKEGVHRRQQR